MAGAHAEAGILWDSSTTLQHSAAVVSTDPMPTTSACIYQLTDIVEGESIDVNGTVGVSNDTGRLDPTKYINIGVTTEIYLCEAGACGVVRSRDNSFSALDGGNVDDDRHHDTFQPFAHIEWGYYSPEAWLVLNVRAYSTAAKSYHRLKIDRCGLLIKRTRP